MTSSEYGPDFRYEIKWKFYLTDTGIQPGNIKRKLDWFDCNIFLT